MVPGIEPRGEKKPVTKSQHSGRKTKSKRQVGYLLSNSSPLTESQQGKLKRELHSGKVKVRKNGRRR